MTLVDIVAGELSIENHFEATKQVSFADRIVLTKTDLARDPASRRGRTVEDYAFPSRIDHTKHMSTRQYARLVDEWVTAVGLRPEEYGTHSLRRTKASMNYRVTGNIRAIQILLGHSKIESTVCYLGVDVEDALLLAERTEI